MSARFGRHVVACLVVIAAGAQGAPTPTIWMGSTGESAAPANATAPGGATARLSWPVVIGENFSSPMFYDLDGDGRLEVIAADRQSTYVFDATGVLLPGWPRTGGSDNVAAVADIDEDGQPEICIASPGAPPLLRCFNVDGTAQAGFPVELPYQYWLNVTAPAIADVDGDGHLDVGAQTEPGVAFFDRFGQALPGWPYLWSTSQNIVWSAPAVADLDGDGRLEVVVGTNCVGNCAVHVIRDDGTAMPGWPCATQNIFSSPAVGDLDGDGDLEIVIQEGDPTWYGNQMHVWHHDGSYAAGWPRAIAPQWESSRSNPALADVDGDGKLEIVTATGDGMLHVMDKTGAELPGYPRALPSDDVISSVAVMDVDADGLAEFFLCYWQGGGQWVSGWHLDGTTLVGFPKPLLASSQLSAHSSVHLADADGDGQVDLCAQGQTFGGGQVWVYKVDASVMPTGTGRSDWPKIRHDVANTGYCPAPAATPVADAIMATWSLVCYPNPVGRGGQLSLHRPSGGGRLSLLDLAGRRLGSLQIDEGDGGPIGLGSLCPTAPAAGVYLLRFEPARRAPAATTRLVVVD